MNTFKDQPFNFSLDGDIHLHYCGKREKSYDHAYGPHQQPSFLMAYVSEGEADFVFNEEHTCVREGDFYVLFPHSGAHYISKPNVPWSIWWVIVGGEQVEPLLRRLGITERHPVLHLNNPTPIRMTLEAMFNEAGKTDLPHKLVNLSLLYHLFAQLAEEVMPRSGNIYVAAALYHIAGHYAEDLTVGRLADELHLNENYFSKLFKRETGMTPKQAIVTARLEKAKELLRYTDLPVGDVARSVGIDDPLYFSRAFKRYTGYTPSAYHEYTNV